MNTKKQGLTFKSGPVKAKNYSSFWGSSSDTTSVNELLGIDTDKPRGKDPVELAAYKRAISNFVNIMTGKSIPVTFKGKDSYTNGKTVVIGSSLKDNNFDPAVGLALHEAAHIMLSDFEFIKNLDINIPAEFYVMAEKKNIGKYTVRRHLKTLLNYIEDRRIDSYVFKSSPGYKGYYHKMYDKYFYSKIVDKMLLSIELRTEIWEAYEARIINLHNKNTQLTALKGLREIYSTINFSDIDRLKSSADAFEVALKVYSIILNNLPSDDVDDENPSDENSDDSSDENPSDENSDDSSDENSDDSSDENPSDENSDDSSDENPSDENSDDSSDENPSDENSDDSSDENSDGDSHSDGNETLTNDDGSDSVELTENQKRQLDRALEKQDKFLNDEIKKGNVSKKLLRDVGAIESSGATYETVGADVVGNIGDAPNIKCLIVKKLTKELIDSRQFRVCTSENEWRYNRRSDTYKFVEEGLRLGNILGKKLQVRGEENSLKFTRKDSGRLDKRLISELGFGNSNVFSQTFITKYNKAYLHISVDASGSMDGRLWSDAMTSAIAMIKAADMVGNIDVVLSIRSTYTNTSSYMIPLIVVCYDSRVDKLSKVKSLFRFLNVDGTTPEGLCFEAIMKDLIPGNSTQDSYFINYSDGCPMFYSKKFNYRGHWAQQHTRKMVNEMKKMGIKVMSYFISDSYISEYNKKAFTSMYGDDASFIKSTNMMQVAKTMNAKFLEH